MKFRAFLIGLAALLWSALPSQAQSTKAQLLTQLNACIYANTQGAVTPACVNAFVQAVIESMCGIEQASDCSLPTGVIPSSDVVLQADTTGTTVLDAPLAAALATGKNVFIPPGTYTLHNWIDMVTPGQRVYCGGPATTITAVRAGYAPSPMLVIEPSATDARFANCTLDHNGGQYLGTGPYVPLSWNNTTVGTHTNDGLGNAVLVMADRAKLSGVNVKRGWDNCIGLGLFNLTTGSQTATPAPSAPVVTEGTTSYCGTGVHNFAPNYEQGAGVDVLTASGAIVSLNVDWYSYDGFWVDTSGGASASLSDDTAFYTQISPTIFSGGWLTTPGGNAFYFSGANINFDGTGGNASDALAGSSCTNCTAIMPQAQGIVVDDHSNGTIISNFRAVRPGLQCIWDKSGQTRFTNTYCDSPNYLAGFTGIAPGTAAPNTAAIQVDATATAGVTAQFRNTFAIFDGLTVFNTGSLNYTYAVAESASGGAFAGVTVTSPNVAAGATGYYSSPGGSSFLNVIDPLSINSTNITTVNLRGTGSLALSGTIAFANTPTVLSGFGTGPAITAYNGNLAFRVNVGTGGVATSGVISFNSTYASPGMDCSATDITTTSATVFQTKAVASTTGVTLTNYNDTGSAAAWASGDTISVVCIGD